MGWTGTGETGSGGQRNKGGCMGKVGFGSWGEGRLQYLLDVPGLMFFERGFAAWYLRALPD